MLTLISCTFLQYLYLIIFNFKPALSLQVCNIKEQKCFEKADTKSEYERWDCYGQFIFRSITSPDDKFIEHDANGVGWGNSMRALYNSFGLASLMNRRLIIRFITLSKLWDPPYGGTAWDHGLVKNTYSWGYNDKSLTYKWFEFEKYGRGDLTSSSASKFDMFIGNLSMPKSAAQYSDVKILNTGVSVGVSSFILRGNCTTKLLTNFGRCAAPKKPRFGSSLVSEQQLLVPFFYMTFSRPSALMVEKLSLIRERLALPKLPVGLEPYPGLYGLHTPGYYILALHFRRIPLGFEPLSAAYAEDRNLQFKREMLAAFWHHAKKFAQQAQAVAHCRGEQLLIYFATDDVHNLRSVATEELSQYGRVIFGLKAEEVGHVSPQWTPSDDVNFQEQAMKLLKKGYSKEALAGRADPKPPSLEAVVVGDAGEFAKSSWTDSQPDLRVGSELVNHYDRSEDATHLHGIMSLVEWWVLCSANWLVSHVGTSYSDTAAGWGFGPHGRLERLDFINNIENVATTFRKDWTTKNCRTVYAADPSQAKNCPNKKL